MQERTALILAAVVKEYINSGKPIGSRELTDKYNLNVSPATVRNEMSELEKQGYLKRPHISAGRVPTDEGYRFFVQELMRRFELSQKQQIKLQHQLKELKRKHEEFAQCVARLLSGSTEQAAFVLWDEKTGSYGAANLVDTDTGPDELRSAVDFLERIDEHANSLLSEYFEDEPEVYIGKEMKLANLPHYTLIVTGVRLPSGKKGLIGLVGPKRMKYEKNLSVVEYIAQLLSKNMSIAAFIILLPAFNTSTIV